MNKLSNEDYKDLRDLVKRLKKYSEESENQAKHTGLEDNERFQGVCRGGATAYKTAAEMLETLLNDAVEGLEE